MAAGCVRGGAPPVALPTGPITLGWRFVPGTRLHYRTVVKRVGAVTTSEAQTWSYLVTDVTHDGTASLEGGLTGFGTGVLDREGQVVEEHRSEPPVHTRAMLRLTLDGHLTASDVHGFADGLPHRMLALGLPVLPVRPHDGWPDRSTAAPFAALLPAALEVEQRGESRLIELSHQDRSVAAAISTLCELKVEGGAALSLTGVAMWDASLGQLAERTLHARMTPSVPDPEANPGVLEATLTRI